MVRGLLGNGLLLQVALVAVAAGLASAGTAVGGAQNTTAVSVEVRVWQHVSDDRDIHISARPVDGSWRTLGTIPLPLEDGLSSTGRYRYGDIALHVRPPLRSPVSIEVRVWQDVRDGKSLYVSARPADGLWATLGTIPLPLEDGFSSDRTFRYGDISLSVPLPSPAVDACSNGIVVPEPERNPGLVRDCEVLLGARDILAGSGTAPRWSTDRPIGEWTGINLSSSPPRVTEINLWGELKGRLPPSLGQLDELRSLHLRDAALTGGIPPELAALSHLDYLDLSSNGLTGPIPVGLASLSNLRTLKLGGNQLTGEIPAELRSLQNLTHLNLGGNRLTGEIPTELATIPYLWNLTLGGNQLTGTIPPEFGEFRALRSLHLTGNRLTGKIPPELGGLEYLTHLDLGQNELTGSIPPELGALTNLVHLFLYNNRLTGEIPGSLDSLPMLIRLSLVNNPLTGCISRVLHSKLARLSWDDGTSLGQIDLPLCDVASTLAGLEPPQPGLTDRCSRDGAVPQPEDNPDLVRDCAVLLEARTVLAGAASPPNWSANRPIGDWEGVELGGAPLRVTSLELTSGGLRGRIPAGIARLTELKRLDLADNSLNGGIPAELGALVDLETLRLNGNELSGEIPGDLGHLRYLGELNLFGNRLTGQIPEGLSDLENLSPGMDYSRIEPLLLDLRNNRLTGGIPIAFAELAKGTRLDLRLTGNRLTGCIPLALGGALSDRAALGLTYCQCPSALLFDREYRPALTLGADGIPFMPRQTTDLAGTYRLSPSLVTELPSGGRYLLGELMRNEDGDVAVKIEELTSHSHLIINALTGEELSRSVVESPSHCRVSASNLFDQLVRSARVQPLGPPRDPDGVHRLKVFQTVDGGRSYRIDGSNFLVIDVPRGMRLTLEYVRNNRAGLRDEASGSVLTLDATTGRTLSRRITGADGERDVGSLFDRLAASVREHPAPSSCDDPRTAPDCQALLEAKATFGGSRTLNWSAFTPVEDWQGVTVSRWTGRVVEVGLFSQGLAGPIPLSLSRLSALERLDLYRNDLTGGIPPELGLLTELRELRLGENPLGGGIPPELGSLASLVTLNLYGTGLVGEIPEELGSLESLETLMVYGNNLEGCIPDGLLQFDFNIHSFNNPHLRRCGTAN